MQQEGGDGGRDGWGVEEHVPIAQGQDARRVADVALCEAVGMNCVAADGSRGFALSLLFGGEWDVVPRFRNRGR